MSVNSTITNLSWAVILPVKWQSGIPRLTLRIPCSVYQILFQLNLKNEFQSLVCFRIPWAAGIPDSKAQDSGFHNKKTPRFRKQDFPYVQRISESILKQFFSFTSQRSSVSLASSSCSLLRFHMITFQNLTYHFLFPQISGYNTLFTLQVNCNAPQMPFCCVIHLDSVSYNSLDSTQLDRSR